MNFLAIDPSLNSTGLAFSDQTTALLKPPKGMTGPARLVALREKLREIILGRMGPAIEAVVLEDYSYASAQGAHQIGEWGGVLRVLLHELGLPVAMVSPSSLKKFVTGKGNAKKIDMVSELSSRLGRTFSMDEADAWGLGAMAAAHYGTPWLKMPKDRDDALAKVVWP